MVSVSLGPITDGNGQPDMAEKITLPFFGETDPYVILAVGGGTVVIIGAIWWRYHQQQTQQNKPQQQQPEAVFVAGQLGVDPAGNSGAIDPETGYVYGSIQDEERLGQLAVEQYGAVQVYTPSQFVPDVRKEHGTRDNDRDRDKKDKDPRDKDPKDVDRPVSNDQWADTAIASLSDEFDPAQLQETVQSVLQGRTVSAGQRDDFLRVTAKQGPPPQGFPGINTHDTAAHPNAGNAGPPFPNVYQQYDTQGMT